MSLENCNELVFSTLPQLTNIYKYNNDLINPLYPFLDLVTTKYCSRTTLLDVDISPMHEVVDMNEEECEPVCLDVRQGKMSAFYKCLKLSELNLMCNGINRMEIALHLIHKLYKIALYQMNLVVYDAMEGTTYVKKGSDYFPVKGVDDGIQKPIKIDTFDTNALYELMNAGLSVTGGGNAVLLAPYWAIAQIKKAISDKVGCCTSYESLTNGFRATLIAGGLTVISLPGLGKRNLFPWKETVSGYARGYLFFEGAIQTHVAVGSELWKTCCEGDISIKPAMNNSYLAARYLKHPTHKMGGNVLQAMLFAGAARASPHLIFPVDFKIPTSVLTGPGGTYPASDAPEVENIMNADNKKIGEVVIDIDDTAPKKGGK